MIPRRNRIYRKRARTGWRDLAETAKAELGLQNTSDALEFLRGASTPDEMRIKVLSMLGGLQKREAIPEIVAALQSARNADVSQAAASALTALASRRATRLLMRAIRKTKEPHVIFSSVYALWFLRDRRSEQTLRSVVNSKSVAPKTRGLAAEAMGQFRTALPFLMQLRDSPIPDIRIGALFGAAPIALDQSVLRHFEKLRNDNAMLASGQRVSDLAERIFNPEDLPQ